MKRKIHSFAFSWLSLFFSLPLGWCSEGNRDFGGRAGSVSFELLSLQCFHTTPTPTQTNKLKKYIFNISRFYLKNLDRYFWLNENTQEFIRRQNHSLILYSVRNTLILGNGCLGSRNRFKLSLHIIQVLIYWTFKTNSIKEGLKWLFLLQYKTVLRSCYWARSCCHWRHEGFCCFHGKQIRRLILTGRIPKAFPALCWNPWDGWVPQCLCSETHCGQQ